MSYIEYKNYPVIPEDIQNKILEIAKEYELTNQSAALRISAKEDILAAIEKQLPVFDSNSLGVSFNDANALYNDPVCNFGFLEPPTELVNWVKENITIDFLSINIQVSCGGKILIPHIDEIRKIALNYLITPGGDRTETVFYRVLPQFENLKVSPLMAFPLERLEKIYSEIIPVNKWHCLDVQTIHNAINLDTKKSRVAVTISLV